jgi:hypothetical protein
MRKLVCVDYSRSAQRSSKLIQRANPWRNDPIELHENTVYWYLYSAKLARSTRAEAITTNS